MPWTEFFVSRLPHIYFVYGLSFFVLGIAVALEIGRGEPSNFRQAIWPLAIFGLVHGIHEWLEMFILIGRLGYDFEASLGFNLFRLSLLVFSFILLLMFGAQMGRLAKKWPYSGPVTGIIMLLLYLLGALVMGQWLQWDFEQWTLAADTLARYTLAIPGSVLAAWALFQERQKLLKMQGSPFANDLFWVGVALLLYGTIGQFFIGPSLLFPSNLINAATFQNWFGIPIQLFRAVMAAVAAIFTVRAMRAFEYNRQHALLSARRQVEEEILRRNALQKELLQRIVETQEDERRRIARELHDGLGQVLTGLALGLRSSQTLLRSSQTLLDNPEPLQQRLSQLEAMAVEAVDDMRYMVNELRPALLDDLGLPAALKNYVDNFTILTGIPTDLKLCTTCDQLEDSIKTILFRITQEALTNIARHAQATEAWVHMGCTDKTVTMHIKDNGIGFDPQQILQSGQQKGWGLLGIQERVQLVDGNIEISSVKGEGTEIIMTVPKR